MSFFQGQVGAGNAFPYFQNVTDCPGSGDATASGAHCGTPARLSSALGCP